MLRTQKQEKGKMLVLEHGESARRIKQSKLYICQIIGNGKPRKGRPMPKVTKETRENRETQVINAMLLYPSVAQVSKAVNIPTRLIYTMMQKDSFKERLREAREQATAETITYLQGNLSTCAESLMEIVKDKNISPQVRVNAINAVFNNLKILNGDSDKFIQGVAVQIYDSI